MTRMTDKPIATLSRPIFGPDGVIDLEIIREGMTKEEFERVLEKFPERHQHYEARRESARRREWAVRRAKSILARRYPEEYRSLFQESMTLAENQNQGKEEP